MIFFKSPVKKWFLKGDKSVYNFLGYKQDLVYNFNVVKF